MPHSMTGFARQESRHPWGTLSCEIRSVNHRYLETSLRLPDSLRVVEPQLRQALRKQLGRGKVEAFLYLKTDTAAGHQLELDTALAGRVAQLAERLREQLESPAKINPLEIMNWPGVMKTAEIDQNVLTNAALGLFNTTLQQLIANRSREGGELQHLIVQRLDDIAAHVAKLRGRLPELLQQHQQKLRARLDALEVDVDVERFNQELVYIAQRADVAEELDRLQAHLAEVRHTLAQQGPIGRRLDFLMQELNREANTLSSKSMASDTTQSAVDMKVLIEQMREQIQNIE